MHTGQLNLHLFLPVLNAIVPECLIGHVLNVELTMADLS